MEGVKILTVKTNLMTLKVLRNFGHTLRDIIIFYNNIKDNLEVKTMEIYVAKYCSESLEELRIMNRCNYERSVEGAAYTFEDNNKPFPNIRELKLDGINYIQQNMIDKLFPNLNRLNISISPYFKDYSVIEKHFPNLKSFSYDGMNEADEIHIINMLTLNPQLEQLKLQGSYSPRLIKRISENVLLLKHIHLINFNFTVDNGVQPLPFDNVFNFKLDNFTRTSDISSIELFTFSKLNQLSVPFDINLNDINTYQPILNFIQRNTQVKSITLNGLTIGNLDALFDFEHILSNVEELNITRYRYSLRYEYDNYNIMSSVLLFLKRCQSVKKLFIKADGYCFNIRNSFRIAFATHCIEYKINENLFPKCKLCRNQYEMNESVEFTIRKSIYCSLRKYNCSYRSDIDNKYCRTFDNEVIYRFVIMERSN